MSATSEQDESDEFLTIAFQYQCYNCYGTILRVGLDEPLTSEGTRVKCPHCLEIYVLPGKELTGWALLAVHGNEVDVLDDLTDYPASEVFTERQREVIGHVVVHERSYSDTAARMGVAKSTVRQHMLEVRRSLRRFVAAHDGPRDGDGGVRGLMEALEVEDEP